MSYEALPDGRSGIAAARHDAGWVASSLEWDRLDKAMDKLYHEVARGCGISDRAYWILSAIEESGEQPLCRSSIPDGHMHVRR